MLLHGCTADAAMHRAVYHASWLLLVPYPIKIGGLGFSLNRDLPEHARLVTHVARGLD